MLYFINRRMLLHLQKFFCRKNHSRSAEPALHCAMINERLLDRVQGFSLRHPFNGGDLPHRLRLGPESGTKEPPFRWRAPCMLRTHRRCTPPWSPQDRDDPSVRPKECHSVLPQGNGLHRSPGVQSVSFSCPFSFFFSSLRIFSGVMGRSLILTPTAL